MEWIQSSSQKSSNHPRGHFGPSPTQNRHQPNNEPNPFTNDIFISLKQSYEERLQSLENTIKETYYAIDNDEIANTMKMNEASEEFRRLRVQEIVEDSLLAEKEHQITKLLEANAYLEAELLKTDDERQKVIKVYQEEVGKFQKTVEEFEEILQKEAKEKHKLEEENKTLLKKLETAAGPESSRHRFEQSVAGYQNEISDLKQEITNLKNKLTEVEYIGLKKEEVIKELNQNLKNFKQDYGNLEASYNNLIEEYNEMKAVLDKLEDGGANAKGLQERLEKTERELAKANATLQAALSEKASLINKSEYITTQAQHLVEKELKAKADTLEGVQQKWNSKKAKYKRQIDELESENQVFSRENRQMKLELSETKALNEKLTNEMESNIKLIKNEWEKKCQEIELSSQKAMNDITLKYQTELSELQHEYQSVLDRKLSELHNEASVQISKSKNADIEIKAQLEGKVAQIEKDYISKTKHENILANEILDLKAMHAKELRDLEERMENDYNNRIRDVLGKSQRGFESDLREVKEEKRNFEQQFLQLKTEYQKNKDSLASEKDKTKKLSTDLSDLEKKYKDVKTRLDEAVKTLQRFKELYEEEARKAKVLAQEKQENTTKILALEKKEASFDQLSSMLRNEISTLSDQSVIHKARIGELEGKNLSLTEEISTLKNVIDELEKEKSDLNQKVRELIQEVNKGTQRVSDAVARVRAEEEERLEHEIAYRNDLQKKLDEVEPRNRSLENQLNERDEKIRELSTGLDKIEKVNQEFKARNIELDDELRTVKNDNKQLQKRIAQSKQVFNEKISKIWRLYTFKTETLRNELSSLRSRCSNEFESYAQYMQDLVEEIGAYSNEKLLFERQRSEDEKRKGLALFREEFSEKLEKQQLDHIQEKEQLKNEFESILAKLARENDTLRNDVVELKGELQEILLKIERANQGKLEAQKRLAAFEEENNWLKGENAKKDEEFEGLQKFVQGELRRVKEESERITNEVAHQTRFKQRQELDSVIQALDELKYVNMKRLKQMETDLMNYEMAHETDIVEIIERNQNEIDKLKEQLREYERDLGAKDREITELRKDLLRSRELYKEVQQENYEMVSKFEDKIEDFKDMMKTDNAKYLEKKSQSNHEIEALRNQLRDVTRELKAKNQEIEGMDYRIKTQKDEILRYKSVEYDRPQRSIDIDKPSQILRKGHNESESFLSKPIYTAGNDKLRFTTEENRPNKNIARDTSDFTLSKNNKGYKY